MEDRPEQLSSGGQMLKAREMVRNHFYLGLDLKDVYIVWFTKTLQNWKALVSTNIKDNMYYELTYNGDKRETYIDLYSKVENIVVPDESSPI